VLHPQVKPYIPNSKPQTPNPKPQTPNPKPSTTPLTVLYNCRLRAKCETNLTQIFATHKIDLCRLKTLR
jgi:hypothetical protein